MSNFIQKYYNLPFWISCMYCGRIFL